VILVTGAGGLLGANLVADLVRRSLNVTGTSARWLPRIDGAGLVFCDLTSAGAAAALVEDCCPTSIIHCAALTNVDACEADSESAWRVNVEMPKQLAVLAAERGAQFVHISTDSVFDGKRGSYAEEDAVGPVNTYAWSKLKGEIAVQEAFPEALILRTNIYGWNMQRKASLAEWILNRLGAGVEVPGFDDVIFCPILVNDLVDLILEMLDRKLTGLFHAVGSEACSKYEFALRVAKLFGADYSLVRRASVDTAALGAPRPKNVTLKVERLACALGRRIPTVDDGLNRFKNLRDDGFVSCLKQVATEAEYACIADR
jgi:dTDP-4-dehydrorhamnose reductase